MLSLSNDSRCITIYISEIILSSKYFVIVANIKVTQMRKPRIILITVIGERPKQLQLSLDKV